MFGAICAGRLVQTNLQQVAENQFVFQLDFAESLNHIVVFLLPTAPFAPGMGAKVYFQWPGKPFQFLGYLTNDKPSAIFRLKNTIQSLSDNAPCIGVTAVLGISVEPTTNFIETPAGEAAATSAVAKPLPPTTSIAQRILRNLYNFLASFAISHLPPNSVGLGDLRPNDTYIPLKVFQDWHTKFLAKINNNPNFLDSDDQI
ncbi:inositol metabolism protein Opi10 [Schizosaccharomyces cryophilus OY26]|uniref:Inositol metabolism protein Opi10 n=1 Tax=Schizosaccharomyces cryophilus (strain OY26 / ATCC MYA-4695 / CBS 11777 / NBRC 106824 / NRRL Y48691) TaxID=653667 RepID=S9W2K2_SCHCR|nr:inositol metabolism protein Opi10 [Schizosaccharomyces cryophilus OY26]EPY54258.1 inositol metabolism protein Opi10 [Schizosaccharomyces cryophilus OY26]